MSDTRIHIGNTNLLFQKNHKSIGKIGCKSVLFDPKQKPLFVVFIILGLIGLGVAGIGVQHHWWSASLINQFNQTQSLIFTIVGGLVGTGFLVFGIIGIAKICKTQQETFHSPSIDFTTTVNEPLEHRLPNYQNSQITQEKREIRNRTGRICMTTTLMGGYVGHPSKRMFLPDYLKNITLEDGSCLPLDEEDLFCEFELFNRSHQLVSTGIPPMIYLPSAIFKDKKDGDCIRLKYKGELIELTIEQQNHGRKFAKGTFEEVFASHSGHIKKTCHLQDPLFSSYDPFWFYKLGDKGVVYKTEINRSGEDTTTCHLKEGTSEDFRSKKDPVEITGTFTFSEDKKELILVMEFCQFQPQDVDIMLNETHLIVYGRFENRPLPFGPLGPQQAHDIKGNLDRWEKAASGSLEEMCAFRWDEKECFKGSSLEEMKDLVKKSTLLFSNGFLQLHIPLHTPNSEAVM